MLKNFAGPNFHASKLQIACYKMQGVTMDDPGYNEHRFIHAGIHDPVF